MVSLSCKFPNGVRGAVSIPRYMAWRQNDVFSAMALYDQSGASPMLGRTFTAPEDTPNGPKAAIIGEKLWRSHFASDPAIHHAKQRIVSDRWDHPGQLRREPYCRGMETAAGGS